MYNNSMDKINFDEWKKIEMKVGKILKVEKDIKPGTLIT